MLDNLVHILRNSDMLNFADFERHLQGYDHTLSCHVTLFFADWLPSKCCCGVFSDFFLFKCIRSCETLDPTTAGIFCRDVSDETIEAREKLSSLEQWQQMQAEKNSEKLHLAFLKKQVEKLKSSAKGTHMQQPNS